MDPSLDPSVDPQVDYEFCSYCESRTRTWCPECFGCPTCCPHQEHCSVCGQSTRMCEATACGGNAR